jgi:hypothetical protein
LAAYHQGVNFEYGVRRRRPDETSPADFVAALDEAIRGRVGGVPIELELSNGASVEGIVYRIHQDRGVELEEYEGPFPSEHILAVTLIDDEPPIDHSDELGRG